MIKVPVDNQKEQNYLVRNQWMSAADMDHRKPSNPSNQSTKTPKTAFDVICMGLSNPAVDTAHRSKQYSV